MQSVVHLRLLGVVQVEREGALVQGFESRKALALLGYLALRSQAVERSYLADLCWSELPEARGRANLSWVLNKLSALLPGCLHADRHTIQFRHDPAHWLDVRAFDALVAQGDATALTAAVELYRGELMEGLYLDHCPDFETWLLAEREAWHQRITQVLQTLINYHTNQQAYDRALGFTARLLALEPWREEVHRQRMHLLADTGQQSAALQQYESCRRILAAELNALPSQETTTLYEQIRARQFERRGAEEPRYHDDPPNLPASVNTLPAQLTPLIGRTTELATLAQLLEQPACRLVSIVGLGGVGKTRLALQAAAAARPAFRHGVCWVPLTPVSSAEHLAAAIVQALGLRLHAPDLTGQLLNYLRERELLLVLDSLEHLLAGAGLLADILQQARRVKLLVTSRERLSLREEWVLGLWGLPYPAEAQAPAGEDTDAVQLFLDCARRTGLETPLTEADIPFIARICRQVEGLPLAIEMAAGWTRVLTCAEIAGEMDRLQFLRSSLRDLPPRHHSIAAVFDHSWQFLSPKERALFTKLSIFRGGFRREAAAQVADASVELLGRLVDTSFLRLTAEGRYEIHELLRLYGQEKLEKRPAAYREARDRHAAYYAAWLEEQETALRGEQRRQALAAIGEEIGNVRAGWGWAVAQCHSADLARALKSLYGFYDAQGWFQEGEAALGQAAEALGSGRGAAARAASDQGRTLARLLMRQSAFSVRLGHYERARGLLRCSLTLCQRLGAHQELARCLNHLSGVALEQGAWAEAEQLSQESLALARAIGDPWGTAFALEYLGRVALEQGNYGEARAQAQQSLALFQALGHRRGIGFCIGLRGIVAIEQGNYAELQQLAPECLAIYRELDDQWALAMHYYHIGRLNHLLGRSTAAQQLLQESLLLARKVGYQSGVISALNKLGELAENSDAEGSARAYWHEALQVARQCGATPLALDVLVNLAALLAKAGELERAMASITLVLDHPASQPKTRDKAERLYAHLLPRFSAESLACARERGRTCGLEAIAEERLREQPALGQLAGVNAALAPGANG